MRKSSLAFLSVLALGLAPMPAMAGMTEEVCVQEQFDATGSSVRTDVLGQILGVTLQSLAVNPDSIEAKVSGLPVSFTVSEDTATFKTQLNFESPLSPTAVIDVLYCLEAKVLICHLPPGNQQNKQNITVGQLALKAHIAHGDFKGSCNPAPTPTPTTGPVPTATPTPSPTPSAAPTPMPLQIVAFDAALGSNSAVLLWSTPNVPSTSQVLWDVNPGLTNATPIDTAMTVDHTVIIGGLEPNTVYFFQAVSTDALGRTVYSDVGVWSTTW